MTSPPTIVLNSTHDALLQKLAEARAERAGVAVQEARLTVEIEALLIGIGALQTAESVLGEQRRVEVEGS